jgi:hypothetical protein
MLSNFEITPNKGYGDIKFGMDMDKLSQIVGEPEEIVSFDDEELSIVVLHYWNMGFSVFMDGITRQVVAGIELDNLESKLFGQNFIGKSEKEIVELLKVNGHTKYEVENEDVDKRYSYDEGMMDFFFVDGKLEYMNFGVLVDEEGNIETV